MGRIFPSRLPTVPAEGLFQAFLTQVPVALFCKDPQGRFLFVNQRFCEELGKEPEEILGKTDFDLFPPEQASKYQADDQQVLRTRQPLETVEPHTVPTPEGPQTRYVHVLKVPLYAPNGELIGVQGVFWDETRRYEAERELRHERRLFQALLENIPDAVYFKDRQSRFVRVSKSMVHLFRQQSADQIIGKTDFDFFTEQHARQAYEDEQEIIRTGRPIVNKKEKETWPNRPPTYALTSKIPLRDETGKIIGTLGISKDITSLVQAQEELATTAKQLQQALRVKSQFLSHISHELRTPLDVIIRSADLLLDTPHLDAENRELVAQIRHGAETLLRLVTDILTLHRLEASQVKLHLQDFDLVDLVQGTVEFLAPLAHDKGLELICLIDPQLPRFHGDPNRIRQVLHNLIGNAIKFTEQGEITVRVEQKKTDPDQIWFRFEVEDTGPGIPEDQLHQIFQPFTQVDISSTRKHPGAGLGLAICKELVELMNGRIGVESTQGKGSKFFFELPLAPAKEQPQVEQTPPSWHGQRALVMSANPKSRSALQRLLQSEGLEVVTTAGPLHAAIQFQQSEPQGQPFQWVFLDTARLEDSLALSQTIRLSTKTPPHVVLLTRLGEWIAPNVADRVGIWRCLIKPPSRQLLRRLLEEGTEPCPLPTRFEQQRSYPSHPSLWILLAEDNPANRMLTETQLQRLGHHVHSVATGKEALEAFRQQPFDAVILDYQMPELDGLETARQIRRIEQQLGRKRTPILALTAHTDPVQHNACIQAGMDATLTKPVSLEELDRRLRMLFSPETKPSQGTATRTSSKPEEKSQAEPWQQEPILDQEPLRLLGFLSSDPKDRASWKELVELFFADLQRQTDRLQTAVQQQDWGQVSRIAHSLKGSAWNLSAKRFAALMEQVERTARNNDTDRLAALMNYLPSVIAELTQYLQSTLNS